MPQNETISLRQTTPSSLGELEVQAEEHRSIGHDQTDQRRNGSKTKRACVLIGSGIIQLPIWGKDTQLSSSSLFCTNVTHTTNTQASR